MTLRQRILTWAAHAAETAHRDATNAPAILDPSQLRLRLQRHADNFCRLTDTPPTNAVYGDAVATLRYAAADIIRFAAQHEFDPTVPHLRPVPPITPDDIAANLPRATP